MCSAQLCNLPGAKLSVLERGHIINKYALRLHWFSACKSAWATTSALTWQCLVTGSDAAGAPCPPACQSSSKPCQRSRRPPRRQSSQRSWRHQATGYERQQRLECLPAMFAGPARKRCLTAHPDALSAVRKASCDHQEQQKATANVLLKKHQRGVRSVLREQRKVCSSSFVALKQPALKQPTGTPAEAGTHECPQERAIGLPA